MNQSGSPVNQMMVIIRTDFGRLWALALWPYLAEVAAIALLRPVTRSLLMSEYGPISPMNLWQSMGVGARCVILLIFVVQVCVPRDLAVAGITMMVSARMENQGVTVALVILRMARILPALLVLSIVAGSFVIGGTMLLFVPGLFFAILTAFLMPSVATVSTWTAARKSLRLSLKSFGPLLLLNLALGVVGAIAIGGTMTLVLMTANGPNLWMGLVAGLIVFVIVLSLIVMLYSVGVAVLYSSALRGAEAYRSAQEAT